MNSIFGQKWSCQNSSPLTFHLYGRLILALAQYHITGHCLWPKRKRRKKNWPWHFHLAWGRSSLEARWSPRESDNRIKKYCSLVQLLPPLLLGILLESPFTFISWGLCVENSQWYRVGINDKLPLVVKSFEIHCLNFFFLTHCT